MAEDKGIGWAKIGFQQTVDQIVQHGPTLPIGVQHLSGEGPIIPIFALIDTGASHNALAPDLIEALSLEPIGEPITARELGRSAIVSQEFLACFHCDSGVKIQTRVTRLQLPPPHGALIGRTLLENCRLAIDFTTGVTSVHFKIGS